MYWAVDRYRLEVGGGNLVVMAGALAGACKAKRREWLHQLSTLLRTPSPTARNETHDRHDHDQYTTSLQRQQQAQPVYRPPRDYSRPSSSSGSHSPILRRTPNFDRRNTPNDSNHDEEFHPLSQSRRPQPRATSVGSPTRLQPTVRFADEPRTVTSRPRASSQSGVQGELRTPHPALYVSSRTSSAILYAVQEALRTPHPFTPDLVEENASMSDLLGSPSGAGRTANGSSRAATGPGPIPTTAAAPGMRTPREIMQSRQAREERRRQEAEEQQRRQQQEEEDRRRRSVERRTVPGGGSGAAHFREPATHQTSADGGPVNSVTAPPPDYASQQPISRPRVTTQPQQYQQQQRPTATHSTTGATNQQPTSAARAQPSTSRPRQPSTSGSAGPSQARPTAAPTASQVPQSEAGPSSVGGNSRNPTNTSFRYAFQRWEDLSSHWEGLTSYWIRRLEQNTEEVRREPLAQQMSRQITDLSAAGANLFHAVVELQRLRASSERKFQRWFFETRQEQERAQEIQMELERSLAAERQARQESATNIERAEGEKKSAEKMLAEMRRELQISKEEARRSWEELGRREQEERDRTNALREGHPTWIGGVQVVPMAGGSRHRGASQQAPVEDDYHGGSGSQTDQAAHHLDNEHGYSYGGESPTDTDPFMGGHAAAGGASSSHEHTYVPYVPGSDPATSGSTARTVIPPSEHSHAPAPLQPHRTPTVQSPISPPVSQAPLPSAANQSQSQQGIYQYQHQDTFLHGAGDDQRPLTEFDDQSYVQSVSEVDDRTEEDWDYDQHGARYTYRPGPLKSDISDDEYNVQDEIERERQHAQAYGVSSAETGVPGSGAGYSGASGTVTAGPATSSSSHSYSEGDSVDYSGAGYGTEWPPGPRHHYPTRLSDVLEEDERSRTSPSRASQASRGMY